MGITISGNIVDLHKLSLLKCTFLTPQIHLTKKNLNYWKHYLIGFTLRDALRPFIFRGKFRHLYRNASSVFFFGYKVCKISHL